MRKLSFTEEYVLCVVAQMEKHNALYANEYEACIIAASLWELLKDGAVELDGDKRISAVKKPEEEAGYKQLLYDYISENKPHTATKIVEHYIFAISTRNVKRLIDSIMNELVDSGHLTLEKKKGLIKEKTVYHVAGDSVDKIKDRLREELLGDGPVSDEYLILAALLFESKMLAYFFAAQEMEQMRSKLFEVKNSQAGAYVKEIIDDIEAMMVAIMVASNNGLY